MIEHMESFKTRPERAPFFSLLALIAAAGMIRAQQPAGEIRLAVEDSSGAGMQAAGTLDNQAFQTDGQGQYDFRNLASGRHRLQVSKAGFATQVIAVEVGAGGAVNEIVKLELAGTASRVDVVDTTPLAGANLSKDQIAAPVQTATASDIQSSGALDLSAFLNRRMNGVYVNENQGNPFQPDVNFRGYAASPLLGTPEGISVYVDGVRQNQPFGDVVAWDLIPKNAIAEMLLVPGSDPLFGLNTLGGAVSVQTKDGVELSRAYGNADLWQQRAQRGRRHLGGGKATGFNWFLSGTGFHESGWRFDSPSDVRQGFVRLGWRTDKTDLAFTTTYAYNTLLGNGIQDYRLLNENYSGTYTPGDIIANRAPLFNLMARHTFSDTLTFSGNLWFRNIRTESVNPNFNTDVFGTDIYQPTSAEQAILSATGYTGFPASGANITNTPFPSYPCIAEAVSQGDPDSTTATESSFIRKQVQYDFGLSGQFTSNVPISGGRNQFSIGFLFDRGVIDYTQNTAYGYANPNRSITHGTVFSGRLDGQSTHA